MNRSLESIFECLPPHVAALIKALPAQLLEKVNEIRLRSDCPVALTLAECTVFPQQDGGYMGCISPSLPVVTQKQIEQTVYSLCQRSIYSHQDELCQGFISLPFGNRAGICGKGVLSGGRVDSLKEISSVNIRIARQVKGCSNAIKFEDIMGGIIIAGPPGSGKTTILRDIARRMSSGESGQIIRTAVADERGEIAAVYQGVCGMDVGLSDVMCGIEKSSAAVMAVRSMNPQLLVFDELGSEDDVKAVRVAAASGVAVAASLHISDTDPPDRNPYYRQLREYMPTVAVLARRPGEIKEIIKNEERAKCVCLGY